MDMDLEERYHNSLTENKFEDCDEILKEFSREHYTFINQIFGDLSVRKELVSKILSENPKIKLRVEKTGDEFENSSHHYVKQYTGSKLEEVPKGSRKSTRVQEPEPKVIEIWERRCSVDDGLQNLKVNINDTLCQSYSLLTYFGIKIVKDSIINQMNMIQIYRTILSNEDFIGKLDEVINSSNKKLWIDHSSAKRYIKMNKINILKKINKVLDDWENYGYWYFIGDGKCPR